MSAALRHFSPEFAFVSCIFDVLDYGVKHSLCSIYISGIEQLSKTEKKKKKNDKEAYVPRKYNCVALHVK